MDAKKPFIFELLLIIAGLCFGYIPIISALMRDNSASSIEQVLIRAVISALFGMIVIITVFKKRRREIINCLSSKVQISYIIQAFILNAMIIVYVIAISIKTPAGEAALLVQVHPIFTLLISYLWLKESLNREKIISLGLAMIGIFILLRPWALDTFFSHFIGDILSISNGLFYSFYIIIGRKARTERAHISPMVSISWVLIWVLIIYIPLLVFLSLLPLPKEIITFSPAIYFNFNIFVLGILLGLFGSVLPYSLIMISSRHVESSKSAILLLGEPLGAIIFGFLILNETILFEYILGGFVLIAAIIIITNYSGTKITEPKVSSQT